MSSQSLAKSTRSVPRTIGRIALGAALVYAGVSHLTTARREFRAQVPTWVPIDEDTVVVASGVVEVGLGAALIALPKEQRRIGVIAAAFFVGVFPGNLAQYREKRDAFGLNSDSSRLVRLFFQPALVAWALWSTAKPKR